MKKYFLITLFIFLEFSCSTNSPNNVSENQNETINIETKVEGVGIVTVENINENKITEINAIKDNISNNDGKSNIFTSETKFDTIDTNINFNSEGTQKFDSIDIGKTINLENTDSGKTENISIKGLFSN